MIRTLFNHLFPPKYRTAAELPRDQWGAFRNVQHVNAATKKSWGAQ